MSRSQVLLHGIAQNFTSIMLLTIRYDASVISVDISLLGGRNDCFTLFCTRKYCFRENSRLPAFDVSHVLECPEHDLTILRRMFVCDESFLASVTREVISEGISRNFIHSCTLTHIDVYLILGENRSKCGVVVLLFSRILCLNKTQLLSYEFAQNFI